ncbi:MAG TPA: toll/interleukin-1 receptor domain-containing protein [Anaerolineales bacterium]
MPPSVFISYSRREAPFVDAFLDALEDSDVQVWVDYCSLVPAQPWWNQILTGIEQADVFLLVVSKESMASKTVAQEYKHALSEHKRIILVIFEAVPLPEALQACEWIDFRGSFTRRRKRLLKQLDQPLAQAAAPQTGFKTSFAVWLAFVVSLCAAVISIPAWWTFYIPILLVPLPLQILRRKFSYYRVRFAVLTLPVVLLLTWIFFLSYPQLQPVTSFCLLASAVIAPLLLILLSSKSMRLWGKPMASAPRFANPYHPDIKRPTPVPFFVENAPEDQKYADALARGLAKHGHPQVRSAAEAHVDLVILSRYKNSTLIDAEKRVVFPILIQDTPVPDVILQRIQWIDFRRGIRHLDSLAKLLPEPTRLLRALGVAPISEQTLYPRIIQMLDYFLILLGFFSISAWLPLVLELGPQFLQLPNAIGFAVINFMLSILILNIVYYARRALVTRVGRFATLGSLVRAIIWIGFIGIVQFLFIIANIAEVTDLAGAVNAEYDMRGSIITFLPISYILGLIVIGFFSIWNWGDLARWFPYREKKAK